MRATAVSSIVSVIGLVTLLAASPAAALSSVDLEWRGTGGSTTITVAGSASVQLIADIVLRVESGASTVGGVFISIAVDENFGNELDVTLGKELSTANLPGMGNEFAPLSQGTLVLDNVVEAGTPLFAQHLITQFDQATTSTGATGGASVTLGSIVFTTNQANLVGDGQTDVRVLVRQDGIDAMVDSTGNRCIGNSPRNDCPYTFGELRVAAPEPTTSALVILGLGIGVLYSRRR